MNTRVYGLCAAAFVAMLSLPSNATATNLEECAACHALEKPKTLTLKDRLARKGPDLYYAGNKYRRDWLVDWLQNPTRLWPGGLFFAPHTVVTDEGDIIEQDTLTDHPRLQAEEAAEVVEMVMALRIEGTVSATSYQPKNVSKRLATMNFRKFKGCGACHQDEEGYGGVSGPELYTAFDRLQPDYIASYIRDPLAWDSKSLMPRRLIVDGEIHKLIDYLKLLSEETP